MKPKSLSKKEWRTQCQKHRVRCTFNTGTRTHKSAKDYKRFSGADRVAALKSLY